MSEAVSRLAAKASGPARADAVWPWWPLVAAAALATASLGFGLRGSWGADLLALLVVLAGIDAASAALARSPLRDHPRWRWLLLGCVVAAASALATVLQAQCWPIGLERHPAWLVPAVAIAFALMRMLPQELNAEAARRSRKVLDAEQARHRSERQLLELRLAALQGQIEPHFLYNTLANTRALIRQDAAAAETMLNHLIGYLRAAVPDLRANATSVGQELDRAAAYLDIMKIRLGQRLSFGIDASDAARACLIPPLALMTLIENAIEHGIEPQLGGGRVEVRAACDGAVLTLSVADDGPGFQATMGDGIGLVNLEERLHTLFGPGAELRIEAGGAGGVRAVITMPAQTAHAADAA
ncbi:MAG: histidine kinase [Pseudomonadota bacterium]